MPAQSNIRWSREINALTMTNSLLKQQQRERRTRRYRWRGLRMNHMYLVVMGCDCNDCDAYGNAHVMCWDICLSKGRIQPDKHTYRQTYRQTAPASRYSSFTYLSVRHTGKWREPALSTTTNTVVKTQRLSRHREKNNNLWWLSNCWLQLL